MSEKLVYKSYLVPKGKGQFPNIIKEYVKEPLPHITVTRNLEEAYRFIDLQEAKEVAGLLNYEVGDLSELQKR